MVLLCIIPLASKAKEVVIKEGDTLSKIATDYGITVREIMDINGIFNSDSIMRGQKIKLPLSAKTKEEKIHYKTHTVQPGETITKIASLYKVKYLDIINLNKIQNPNLISIGDVIDLPHKSITIKESKPDFHIVVKGDTLSSIPLSPFNSAR